MVSTIQKTANPLYLWVLKWRRQHQQAYQFQLAMTFCNPYRKKSSWGLLWWWKSYRAVNAFSMISRTFSFHCDSETELKDCNLLVSRWMYQTLSKWNQRRRRRLTVEKRFWGEKKVGEKLVVISLLCLNECSERERGEDLRRADESSSSRVKPGWARVGSTRCSPS